jgi:catechol 2,3-dioxygenase-like lactoylglutathione lyase family enzyme
MMEAGGLKLGHIELFSPNPDRLSEFYIQKLGFTLVANQSHGFIWLKSGALEILIRPGDPMKNANRYEESRFGFVLYTEDIQAALERLEQAGIVIKGTVDSQKCYTFTDPDGNWFQLVDPEDH